MKNIAYLQNSSQIGGGNRSMIALWQGLQKHPVRPVVFCPGVGPMASLVEDAGLPLYVRDYVGPTWRQPIRTWQAVRHWIQVFRTEKISLIHANDPHVARPIMISAALLKIPVLVHVRFPQSEEYYHWVFKNLPKPAGFILNSKYTQSEIGLLLSDSSPKASQWVVYNAVDLEAFQPCYETGNMKLRVGIIANLSPVKGHEDFIAMARSILDLNTNVVFDIIGADIDNVGRMDHLIETARTKGVLDKISFHGHVSDVHSIIARLDVVVSTSQAETFGRTIIEAMACGKPVVAYGVGGIPEIIVAHQTGFLVPPGSLDELVHRVEVLLADGNGRKKMGKNGRERVEAVFGVDAHARAIMSLYEKLL